MTAVFFDLDDTLYDREAAAGRTAHAFFATYRARLPADAEEAFVARFGALDAHGTGDKRRLCGTMAAEFGLGEDAGGAMHRRFWETMGAQARLPEDTRATLRALRAGGRKAGVSPTGS